MITDTEIDAARSRMRSLNEAAAMAPQMPPVKAPQPGPAQPGPVDLPRPPAPTAPPPKPGPVSPPMKGSALAEAVARRSALRGAIEGLKSREIQDDAPIRRALAEADRDGLITGIAALALGEWLDANLQNPSGELTGWSFRCEQDIIDAAFTSSAEALGSADAYVRSLGEAATGTNAHVAGIDGRPSRNRPPSASMLLRVLVNR